MKQLSPGSKLVLLVLFAALLLSGCANPTVTVTALDTSGKPQSGLPVYVFSGTTKTDYVTLTNEQGQAHFHLPKGNYHFRLDKYDLQFWSDTVDNCSVPGCTTVSLSVPAPVIVKVVDTKGVAQPGLVVYVYSGATKTKYLVLANEKGEVTFNLPAGKYRFMVGKYDKEYWSGASDHCEVPGCTSAKVVLTDQ